MEHIKIEEVQTPALVLMSMLLTGTCGVWRKIAREQGFRSGLTRRLTAAHGWLAIAWTRPGLERKVRSMIMIALLAATNKSEELKAHTLGALRNGCTPDEMKEVFLHPAIYAGVPAAGGCLPDCAARRR